MPSQSVWIRLSSQLDAVATVLGDASERLITAQGHDSWSVHLHLAHLARMHEVLLERVGRILREDVPRLPVYRAEDDPQWGDWTSLHTREVLTRLQALRGELLGLVRGLTDAQLGRLAAHPELGLLPLSAWLEAFCLHEAHHLHAAWRRLAEAKGSEGRDGTVPSS